MFSLLALILIPLGYGFLWPLVGRWLRSEEDAPLQVALTALALSVGGLTLAMFWVGLLPGRWLNGPFTLSIVGIGFGAGLALNPQWVAPRRWLAYWREQWRRLKRLDGEALLLWALVGVLTVVLVNALYYPFIGDDVLVRYGPQAKAIYAAHRLPDMVWGYPSLVPLGFVATWFAAGGPNEHLARLLAFVMAAATLGATYLIGRERLGRSGGLMAAALVALTPLFINNATLAYTDIPTAFPLTLMLFYMLRWWRSGRRRDALLTGLLAGVALFTKQSALMALAGLIVVPLLRLLTVQAERREALFGLAAMLLPPLAIAAPWYARNALLGGWGNIIPIAGQYHLLSASPDVRGLLPPLMWPGAFGLPLAVICSAGWLVGIAWAVRQGWQALRSAFRLPLSLCEGEGKEARFFPIDLILSFAVLPYWLAWWWRFSFDPRFLLLVLPPIAVWSARLLGAAVDWVTRHIRLPQRLWRLGGAWLLAALLLWGARERLGGVYRAVAQPFASDEEKLLAVKGTMYRLVLYARQNLNPQRDRLYLMDERLAYYLSDFEVRVGYPLTLSDLEGYDYLFHSSSLYAVYGDGRLGWEDSEFYQHAFDPAVFEPVYEVEGVHVMRILRTSLPLDGS